MACGSEPCQKVPSWSVTDIHSQKLEQIQTQSPYILYQTMQFWESRNLFNMCMKFSQPNNISGLSRIPGVGEWDRGFLRQDSQL